MTKRKSFIIHKDSLSVLDDLTLEQVGELFLAIKSYQLDEDFTPSPIVKIAFSPFKNQFLRDDEKYQKIVERNKSNGSKGGRPSSEENPEEPTGFFGNPDNPSKADSKSDSDSKSVSGSGSGSKIPYQQIADYYNTLFAIPTDNPQVVKVTDKRKRAIKKFWNFDTTSDKQEKLTNNLDYFKRYFEYCASVEFFNPTKERVGEYANWKPDFDFIVREETLIKIKEGKYK